jgi:hypothetical protein
VVAESATARVLLTQRLSSLWILGEWRGHAASGRRFENVDEVYFFKFEDGRIAEAWGLEETLDRMRQLGLTQ